MNEQERVAPQTPLRQHTSFEEPVTSPRGAPPTKEINEMLQSYDLNLEGVPDAWSLTVSKLTPKMFGGRQTVLPQDEPMPLVPRSELDKVLAQNWGSGLYRVDVRNNGIKKRTLMIEINDEACPPLTKGSPAQQPEAATTPLQIVDRLLSNQSSNPTLAALQSAISDLRREITDIRRQPDNSKSLAEMVAASITSSTQQSIKAMELMIANQNQAAERAERSAQRQQEALNQAMTNLLNVMAENSKSIQAFQNEIFKITSAAQAKESELLLSLLNQSRRNRADDLQEMLQLMNVGLNLGSAMAGATTPEERLIDGTVKVLEKYLDVKRLPVPQSGGGLSPEQVAQWARQGIQSALNELRRKPAMDASHASAQVATSAPAPNPISQQQSSQPATTGEDDALEFTKRSANSIIRALLEFGQGKPISVVVDALRANVPTEVLEEYKTQPEKLIWFLRQFGDAALVEQVSGVLDLPKMNEIVEALKKL